MADVRVVRTGAANIASVVAGLQRCGATASVADDPRDVERADYLVLPGVGAFGAVMRRLADLRLIEPLRERIQNGRATLAMCLGLQLLAESSDESPGVDGLGVIPVRVTRFPTSLCVPQLGWNWVEANNGNSSLQSGYAWYANSYRIEEAPEGWNAAATDHGGPFVAAIQRGSVLACQFHPELSGTWGMSLIKRWLACADNGGATC